MGFFNFLKSTSGNTAITFALVLVPMLAAVSGGIDMARLQDAQTLMQSAADAAALAGGSSGKSSTPAAVAAVAMKYIDSNKGTVKLKSVKVVSAAPDPVTNNFIVKMQGSMQTTFFTLVGMDEFDVSARSEVGLGMQGLELVMALDNTGSMAGTKIAALKSSAVEMINILEAAKASYSDLKFGLVPFAQYVNVGAGQSGASWIDPALTLVAGWQGCIGPRLSPLDLQAGVGGGRYPALPDVSCPQSIEPLSADSATIKTKINAMTAGGSTYLPGGLMWAWNVIDPQLPYTEGRTHAEMKAINGKKVIVLMTDGANTVSPQYPYMSGLDVPLANANLATMCGSVKADNIEVYTILFETADPTINDLLKSCATSADHFFKADNNAALMDAFRAIGKKLADVRLMG